MTLKTALPVCQDVMIIIDTNAIFAKGIDEQVKFVPKYQCDKFFTDSLKNIHLGRYYITESVRREILQQKAEVIEGKRKKLADMCEYFNLGNPDIICNTEDELNTFLKKHHIGILPLPSEKRFSAIMERAFKKNPPFKGKDSGSDKGFKDVILWESVLEYPYERERIGRVILITENTSDFKSEFLTNEFLAFHHGVQLDIMSSWDAWEQESKNLSVELITSNNLSHSSVLDLLQERYPNIDKILFLKKKIQKIDDFVAEVTAEVQLKDGSITEQIYYFDVQNNEPMLDYQVTSDQENTNGTMEAV